MNALPPLLLGCGILEPELRLLARTRGLRFEAELLSPMLHLDPGALQRGVEAQLEGARGRDARVFFGACHPGMDRWLQAAGRRRARGVNCLQMLLGPRRYREELEAGTYFLLERWALDFPRALEVAFGPRLELAAEVFQGAHTRVLAIRTPCSGDFEEAAGAAARLVGLPLAWTTVGLEHLEAVLRELLAPEAGP